MQKSCLDMWAFPQIQSIKYNFTGGVCDALLHQHPTFSQKYIVNDSCIHKINCQVWLIFSGLISKLPLFLTIHTFYNSMFQLQIVVYDSQVPDVRDTETVTITILRNPNEPHFAQNPYSRTILETHELGLSVVDIDATDIDGVNRSHTTSCANFYCAKSNFIIIRMIN